MKSQKIKVVIIDDQKSICAGTKALLQLNAPDTIEVCFTFNFPKEFTDYCDKENPSLDIVISDMRFKYKDGFANDAGGLEVLKYINEKEKPYKSIIYTGFYSPYAYREAMALGVMGYLEKAIDTNEFINEIIKVQNGDIRISEGFRKMHREQDSIKKLKSIYDGLSPLKHEVFQYFLIEKTREDAANKCKMSIPTFNKNLQNIREEFNIHCTEDTRLMAIAIELEIPYVLQKFGISKS